MPPAHPLGTRTDLREVSLSILIVVAHPDDEVLGCGGTAAGLAARGHRVHSCILSGDVVARNQRPDLEELREHTRRAGNALGMEEPILGPFPNVAFNTVPHLEMVRFIEQAITQTQATMIFTHHPADLNIDHQQTSHTCQAAARLFQRRPGVPPLGALYFMEILSSTDWAFAGNGNAFQPDTFFPLGEPLLLKKLKALREYDGVMRQFPHPRSDEIVRGLAALRGGQAGMEYAEAFQTAFHALGVAPVG